VGWIYIPRSVWQRDTSAQVGPSRPLALLAIFLAHGAVLVLLSQPHYARRGSAPDESFTLLFLPLAQDAGQRQSVQPDARSAGDTRPTARPGSRLRLPEEPNTGSADHAQREAMSAPPDNARPADDATAPIDWQAAASAAASDTLRSRERAERQAHALDHAPAMDAGHEVTHGPLIWDRSRTNRLEIEPGLILFHFNDRCAALLLPIPFAFCKVGKITPNGQLFRNMRQYLEDRDTQPLP
jgi:hypothetical protein